MENRPSEDLPEPMPDSRWRFAESRAFSDASAEAAEQGDHERAEELRLEAGKARRQMNVDLFHELRNPKRKDEDGKDI